MRIAWTCIFLAACGSSMDPGMDGSVRNDTGTPIRFDGGPRPDGGASADGQHPFIYLHADNLARLRAAMSDPGGTRFVSMVDSQMGGADIYAFEPWFAALVGQLTGQAQYCTYAVAQTEMFVASEEALIAMGMRPRVAGDSYLEVGPMIANVALVYDWCFDTVSADQRSRWIAYANRAVANVWTPEEAEWGSRPDVDWNGWSINNPANNYYYSFLNATVTLGLATQGENDRSADWLRIFRQEKIGAQLVPTFDRDLGGGGSREGTGYGTALRGLFFLYDLWEASTGERIADLTPHTHASLAHFLHVIVPTGDYLVPVGDHARESTAAFFDYHRQYLLELAYLYRDNDPTLAAIARGVLRHGPLPRMDQGFNYIFDFLYDQASAPEQPLSDLYPAYYGSGTGQMYFRSAWDADATLVHLIGGPFTESHAHQDQGSFLLYHAQWLAYDENYSSHSGIEQAPENHNLVRLVRGGTTVPQRNGGEPSRVIALHDEAAFSWAAVDSATNYADPDVRSMRRDLVFIKPRVVVVIDRVDVANDVQAIWQLNSLMAPEVSAAAVDFDGTASDLRVHRVAPPASEIETGMIDWTTVGMPGDFNAGYRLELRARTPGPVTFVHVLDVDHAVSSATMNGPLSVTLALADGRSATVDLSASTVTIAGAATPLTERVDELPIFSR